MAENPRRRSKRLDVRITLTVTSKWAPPLLIDHVSRRMVRSPIVGSYFGLNGVGNQTKAANFAE